MTHLGKTRLLPVTVSGFFVLALGAAPLLAPATAWGQSDLSSVQCTTSGGSAVCTTLSSQPQPGPFVYAPNYSSLAITNNVTIGAIAIASFGAYAGSSSPPLVAPSISFTNNGTINNAAGYGWSLDAGSTGWMGNSDHNGGGQAGTVTIDDAGAVALPADVFAGVPSLGGLVLPQAGVVEGTSLGGISYADKNGTGKGGAGNNVTITLEAGASIPLTANIAGIFALSGGGDGSGYTNGKNSTYSSGGAGGNVNVYVDGSIGGSGSAASADGVYAMSVGGSSGAADSQYSRLGGNAGTVNVNLAGNITMLGDDSIGIFAASVGGLSWYTNSGSQDGSGGNVNVGLNQGALITTNGEFGIGIAAISTGGNASTTQTPPEAANGVNSTPSTIAPPGDAGNVVVINGGTITTQDTASIGIAAVSSSGGRGIGTMQNGQIDQVGAVGAGAGIPGTVTVTNSGAISTSGTGAMGVLELSLGGPGGVLDSKTGLLNYLGGTKTSGAGTNGNVVTFTNSGGGIATTGALSIGVVAESIGGGGGTATNTGGLVAVGTNGGAGGNGGIVYVYLDGGSISTSGDGSFGILAQSIGGGGGNAGSATGFVAAVGGTGGNGGDGSLVQLTRPTGEAAGAYWTDETSGDFAPAIVLQSVGGGGGNGGHSTAFAYALSPVSAAVGGAGGTGGNGGEADLFEMAPGVVTGGISTNGAQSPGVVAQSIGGGGGTGGSAQSYNIGVLFTDATAVGGTGGSGGNGYAVKLESSLDITTTGNDSPDMLAQSIGGGGGDAGSALTRTETLPADEMPSISITTSVGGTGGKGGSGGNNGGTQVQNDGAIETSGDGSDGIVAQAIGGGGGNGGGSSAYARALESVATTVLISTSLGGGGGQGGDSGAVNVSNGGQTLDACAGCIGSIETSGNNAAGILAQSIGGGGGNGGSGNASATGLPLSGNTGTSVNITLALGGYCSNAKAQICSGGGDGGSVTVDNSAGTLDNTSSTDNTGGSLIKTTGSGAQGILAQSIGGGGGDGGGAAVAGSGDSATLGVSLGSSGGTGGDGGTVTASNEGTIETGANTSDGTTNYVSGGDSDGILAQSIGGGGGVGGSSDAAANIGPAYQLLGLLQQTSASFEADVAVGGSGGTGGDGGTVNVTNTGSISTLGERAYGVLAQSIGGGGGVGGAADSSANSYWLASGLTFTTTVSVGGTGGGGGVGGTVTEDSSGGSIFTAGYGAIGMVAQSIGGGGGVGADGTTGNTTTFGIGATDSGSGGAASNGGTVNVTSGTLVTLGDDAYGVLAQSIGGGGGLGSGGCSNTTGAGFNGVNATLCTANEAVGVTGSAAPWNAASSFTIHVGGGGSSYGSGGPVNVTTAGAVTTTGARAFGVVAQSIGGGGGIFSTGGGNVTSSSVQTAPVYGNVVSNAGNVTVNVPAGGSITTYGAGAWGILAQSIGLGGGFAGDPSRNLMEPYANIVVSDGKWLGHSGTVDVTISGSLVTSGTNAHGIVAQSLGGGGGVQDTPDNSALEMGDNAALSATGTSSQYGIATPINITVNPGATVQTSGTGSVAILAQDSGYNNDWGAAYGAITVNISGAVTGGTNTGYTGGTNSLGAAGIVLSGGSLSASSTNHINIYAGGSLGTMDGTAGAAIVTVDDWTSVTNAGTITGSIRVTGSVTNSGTLNGGKQLSASQVVNNGTFTVGSAGAPSTQLDGDYVQTGTGRLVAGIDALAPQAALLDVTGSAQVSGQVVAAAVRLLPGTYTVLRAGSLSSNASAASSLLFNWRLDARSNSIAITPLANFTPQGVALDSGAASLAAYLARGWNNADSRLASQFGYLSQLTQASQYTTLLNTYSAKATQGQITSMLQSEGAILGAAMSCPVFTGDGVILGEDECIWAKISGQTSNGWANNDPSGYSVTSSTYRLGGQRAVAPDWYVGGSFGATQSWASANGGSSGSGTAYDGSVSVKHTMGPWMFAGSIAVASGAYRSTRLIDLPAVGTLAGTTAVAQSDPSLLAFGGRLRCAYEFSFGDFYVRPYGDLDIIYAHMPGFQESGGDGYALNVNESDKTNIVLSPMVEFGGRYNAGEKTVLRPFLIMGVSLWPTSGRNVEASLADASAANGTFRTYVDTPDVLGNFDAGVQLYRAGGFEVKAEYNVNVGGSFLNQGVTARLAYHF